MFNIVCVTSRKLCSEPFADRLDRLKNADIVILREKDLNEAEYEALAEKFLETFKDCHAVPVLHSFNKVSEKLNCRNLHMPLYMLKKMSEEERKSYTVLGASCHSAEDAVLAESLGCTYITLGHIFATDCKKGLAPRGTDLLKEVSEKISIPVYAIGGITPENVKEVKSAGAEGCCIMSSAMTSESPYDLFKELKENL